MQRYVCNVNFINIMWELKFQFSAIFVLDVKFSCYLLNDFDEDEFRNTHQTYAAQFITSNV